MLHKKIFSTFIFSVMLVNLPQLCFAEFMDGKRDGFVFSIVMGGSGVLYKQYVRRGSPDTVTTADSWSIEPAFAFNGELGYGFTEQAQLIFFNNSSYLYKIRNINGKNVNLDSSLLGIGGCYFFEPAAPSFYINGGIGLSTLASMNSNKSDMDGLGARIGFGYEYTDNFAVDFSAMYTTNYIEEDYVDANVNSFILSLGFKVLIY